MSLVFTTRAGIARPLTVLLGGVLSLVVTACGGGASASGYATPVVGTPVSTTSSGAQQLTVQLFDAMRFEPNAIVVKAGQPVELTITNAGSNDHDFSLSEGVGEPVKVVVKGGQSSTSTFILAQPGTYNFTCSQFGHAGAGMKGTITAQ
jgi:uncharacterized cupredoxin-like copper-binding protein